MQTDKRVELILLDTRMNDGRYIEPQLVEESLLRLLQKVASSCKFDRFTLMVAVSATTRFLHAKRSKSFIEGVSVTRSPCRVIRTLALTAINTHHFLPFTLTY